MSPTNSCAKILSPLWDRCTLSAEIFLLQDTETDPCEACGQWHMAGGCSRLSGHGGHLLWWAYGLSQEAAKADGRAVLCKECFKSHPCLNWSLHALMKGLRKGKVAAFHSCCLELAHSQYSHLVQAYGLWKLNWLVGKAVDIGSVFTEMWNEIGLVSFPAPIGLSTTPFSSCHPERISHKWLRDHKVFYTDVILWIQSVSKDWISPLMWLWLYE